jgi:hypothetical protein
MIFIDPESGKKHLLFKTPEIDRDVSAHRENTTVPTQKWFWLGSERAPKSRLGINAKIAVKR